jgi:hypothetical protein
MSSRDEENGMDGYNAILDEYEGSMELDFICGRYGFSKVDC